MASFEIAVLEVLRSEGGRVPADSKTDRGGKTNFGITHKLGAQYGVRDVFNITRAQAIEIYRKHFWAGELGGRLDAVRDQAVANAVFSMAVNTGTVPAVRTLQDALRELGAVIVTDGKIGVATVTAINAARDEAELLSVFQRRWAIYYCKIARERVRLGAAFLKEHVPENVLASAEGKEALLNLNQVENLVGWITRALH